MGVGCHCRPDDAAFAHDDVEHTGRDASLQRKARQFHQGGRGEFGRLGHHGIAGGQGGRDSPGGLMEGCVPRQDDADYAKGIAAGIDVIVGALVDDFAVHDVDDATVKLEVLRSQVHQGCHFAAGFAGIGFLQCTQGVLAPTDDAPEFVEDAATLGRAHVAPGGQGCGCRVDGQGDILWTAVGDFAAFGTGARVDLVRVLPIHRRKSSAIDEAVNFYKHMGCLLCTAVKLAFIVKNACEDLLQPVAGDCSTEIYAVGR
ncbi:hypothetical protein D3C85_1094250 [compost metagenome]